MKISKKTLKRMIKKISSDLVGSIDEGTLERAVGDKTSVTLNYLIVTADPQFPWFTSRALTKEPTLSPLTKEAFLRGTTEDDCKKEIRAQYTAIQNFRKQHAGQIIPVMLNGDITAFGHEAQRDFMYEEALPILGDHVYLGLGNHDYDNNVDDTYDNAAATGSVVDFKNYMFNTSGKVDNADFYIEHKLLWEGWSGSFAYSKTLGDVHLIQLNYFPFYTRKWASTFPTRDFNITESIAWLEEDWRRAAAAKKIIIVNMHWAPDDDPKEGWTSTALKALVDDYPPAAVFAGHTHVEKRALTAKKTLGDVPLFIIGASFSRHFILVEYDLAAGRLWVSGVEKNDIATKHALHNEVLVLPPQKPSFHFLTCGKEWITLNFSHPLPGVTYELTNSKGEEVKVDGHEYTEWGLNAGKYYEYRMCAVLNGIRSGYSIAGGATRPNIQVPEIVIWKDPEISGSEVELKWNAVDTEDTGRLAHYLVYQDGKVINALPGTTLTFRLVTGLSTGQTYRFQIEPYIPAKGKKNEPLVITF